LNHLQSRKEDSKGDLGTVKEEKFIFIKRRPNQTSSFSIIPPPNSNKIGMQEIIPIPPKLDSSH
jgi:hypothetical protein